MSLILIFYTILSKTSLAHITKDRICLNNSSIFNEAAKRLKKTY